MQAQVTPLDSTQAIGITFTDTPVTPFGGLALFVAFAQPIGLVPTLAEALPFVLASPNATPPHLIVLAFLAVVLAGVRHLSSSRSCRRMCRSSTSSASHDSRVRRRSAASSGASPQKRRWTRPRRIVVVRELLAVCADARGGEVM